MKRDARKTPAKMRRARVRENGSGMVTVTVLGDKQGLRADTGYDQDVHTGPVHINPESKEKREKRLAARKLRTLRAFQMAYEDHHRRKDS